MSEIQAHSESCLPFACDKARILLLARDPHCLYAYWEIPDSKKTSFCEHFGFELWEKSVPVLKVSNVSKNTEFDIAINDLSSSAYINVPDAGCLYCVQLGRLVSDKFFISFASSDYVFTPGGNLSTNTAVYFINYKILKHKQACDTGNDCTASYPSMKSKLPAPAVSSHEFLRTGPEELPLGISSAELLGIPPGISSCNLFKY
ncbi:uncharacterized protein DUF4912 [Anaerobacterium chartisolvens]|uniref:Uncharacterized protein DUF4912 n=1 Tax=Anaerobacterium chartisolvens TaxID=1297424 RepID=A0A369BF37_9FIRM|nr:DUF4912 domain-containing protein [Anaerobacterium chartisolvens]RCX20142.1 uncharacterized protein DUF4912 [Anaerobacterium chartisolvens]